VYTTQQKKNIIYHDRVLHQFRHIDQFLLMSNNNIRDVKLLHEAQCARTSSNSSVILRIMSACSMLWYMLGVMRPRQPEQWMKNWISSSSAASRSCLYASIHSSTTV